METRCSVIGCQFSLNDGDLYFCNGHRQEWTKFVTDLGIKEKMIPVTDELKIVDMFRQGKQANVRVTFKNKGENE